VPPSTSSGPIRAVWSAVVGAVVVVVGLVPHVLHHVGFLVGAALITGSTGMVLFGIVGLMASVPMLRRLRRRFDSWWAPGIALGVFVAMFSLSTFIIGPMIGGGSGSESSSTPAVTRPSVSPSDGHVAHHQS
jgi:hypothetical protein